VYVLDCGHLHLQDGARVSPNMAGKPVDLLDSCYLIHTAQGYVLWETGAPDALATTPAPANTALVLSRTKTLASQLAELNVKPSDLRYVMVSHMHADHSGNVDLFPTVPVLIQKAEYDAAFAEGRTPPFSPSHPVEKIEGDKDVFGDGALTLVSTTGHTPGHQSLLLHLQKTGWVVLAGDAVQIREQWDRWTASPTAYDQRLAPAMRRVGELVAKYKAQVWFSHDPTQANEQRAERKYFE
jgi:glyoxylase-like metal-dependent hydrolase (beta-lactamase superfamily II)